MAWVERDPRGGYRVRWRAGGVESSKLTAGPFTTRGEAESVAAHIEGKVAATRPLTASRAAGAPIPLVEIAERWAAAGIADGSCTPQYTREVCAVIIKLARERGWTWTTSVTPAAIDDWRIERGGRVIRSCSYLGSVLRWAASRMKQDVDPDTLVAIKAPKRKRKVRSFLIESTLVEKYQRRADACGANCGALVHCLSTYPWRPIMAAKLLISDLDLAGATVTHRGLKGGGDDLMHPLTDETVARLVEITTGRPATAPVFLNPRDGQAWSWDGRQKTPISDWWRIHIEDRKAFGVYELKRFVISSMLSAGIPPQDIAAFSGHRVLAQVLAYARTNLDRARAAMALMAKPNDGAQVGQLVKSHEMKGMRVKP